MLANYMLILNSHVLDSTDKQIIAMGIERVCTDAFNKQIVPTELKYRTILITIRIERDS